MEDQEVIAQELSGIGEKVRGLEKRIAEVERVNARLEDAALITARALQEIAGHWDAVYEAMRREEDVDLEEELGKARLPRRFRGGPQPQADPLAPYPLGPGRRAVPGHRSYAGWSALASLEAAEACNLPLRLSHPA